MNVITNFCFRISSFWGILSAGAQSIAGLLGVVSIFSVCIFKCVCIATVYPSGIRCGLKRCSGKQIYCFPNIRTNFQRKSFPVMPETWTHISQYFECTPCLNNFTATNCFHGNFSSIPTKRTHTLMHCSLESFFDDVENVTFSVF